MCLSHEALAALKQLDAQRSSRVWKYKVGNTTRTTNNEEVIMNDWSTVVCNETSCCVCGAETYQIPQNYVVGMGLYCEECI